MDSLHLSATVKRTSRQRRLQRRHRNGWLALLGVLCLAILIGVLMQMATAPNRAASRAHAPMKTPLVADVPSGCELVTVSTQRQALATLAQALVTLPTGIVALRTFSDASGTLVATCTTLSLTASHDAISQTMHAHGWEVAADLTTSAGLSLAFLHGNTVVFATMSAQATTPATTSIVYTLKR